MAINPDLLSLKEAIKIVRPLNFKTVTEYQNWWRKNRPKNLALKARQVYVGNKQYPEKKARDFWSHYLGNKVLSNLEREWLSKKLKQ